MSSYELVDPSSASEEQQAVLAQVQAGFGGLPNLFRMVANAPNVLRGILAFNQEVSSGELTKAEIEQVALLASAMNGCEYCVAVHVKVGEMVGVSREELLKNMVGEATDSKISAVLNFVAAVIDQRGQIDQGIVDAVRQAGYSQKAILEILGVVGVYTFLNYAKHLTQPPLDFPKVVEFKKP